MSRLSKNSVKPIIAGTTASNFKLAAKILNAGGLVAFPTETVYGLGADATNDMAVAKIFEIKKRPSFNPLIVHISNIELARRLAHFDERAEKVTSILWPGPISVVLRRRSSSQLSQLVSAGLNTVALRIPSSSAAQNFLNVAKCPIAAPSANRSGDISPTLASHVLKSLSATDNGSLDMVLDGGPCAVGLESTVLDLSEATPKLLRPGGISHESLSTLMNDLVIIGNNDINPKSPGMLSRHYAPKTPLNINARFAGNDEAMLGFGPDMLNSTLNLSYQGDLTEAASNLFSMLHELDERDFSAINVSPIPERGLGRAINDRLQRAAKKSNT